MPTPYYHIDSFTDHLFSGNPAGVCVVNEFLPPAVMQKIAAENRHSQTAFVVAKTAADFDLRWFTPEVEDDLCGHATLATSHVLALRGHQDWPVRFHTRSGVLTVERDGELYEMDFPAWPAQPCHAPDELFLGLGVSARQVSKSRDYLVVLDNAEQVRNVEPDFAMLRRLDIGIGGVIVTAPGDGAIDYVARFFAPSVGILEDPVTGSIQSTLAPYWSERLGSRTLKVQQLSPRGGELHCRKEGSRVKVAGKARLYLYGAIELAGAQNRAEGAR